MQVEHNAADAFAQLETFQQAFKSSNASLATKAVRDFDHGFSTEEEDDYVFAASQMDAALELKNDSSAENLLNKNLINDAHELVNNEGPSPAPTPIKVVECAVASTDNAQGFPLPAGSLVLVPVNKPP